MIGFDIGGTKCAVCIGEPRENRFIISDKRSFATKDARDPYEMIEWLCSAAEEMTDDLSRVGISCGGPLDTARGLILSPPNLPGWDEIPIVELAEKRLGCRAALRNDADACALAEWRYGAGDLAEDDGGLKLGEAQVGIDIRKVHVFLQSLFSEHNGLFSVLIITQKRAIINT